MHIKKFYGRVENAVKFQLLRALISYLLLRLYHHLCGNGQNLWLFMAKVAVSLFEREEPHHGYDSRRRSREESDLERWEVLFDFIEFLFRTAVRLNGTQRTCEANDVGFFAPTFERVLQKSRPFDGFN